MRFGPGFLFLSIFFLMGRAAGITSHVCTASIVGAVEEDWTAVPVREDHPADLVRSRLLIEVNDPLGQIPDDAFDTIKQHLEYVNLLQFVHRQVEHDGDGHQRRQIIADVSETRPGLPNFTRVRSVDLSDDDPATLAAEHPQIVINFNAPLTLDPRLEMVGVIFRSAIEEMRRRPGFRESWLRNSAELRGKLLKYDAAHGGTFFRTWRRKALYHHIDEILTYRFIWLKQFEMWDWLRNIPNVKPHAEFESILTSTLDLTSYARGVVRDEKILSELLKFYSIAPYHLNPYLMDFICHHGGMPVGYDSNLTWGATLPHALVPIKFVIRRKRKKDN